MIPGSLLTNTDHALSCFPWRGRSVNMNLRVNNLHYFYCNKSDPGPHGEGRGHVVHVVLSQLQFSQWVVLQVSRNLQVALSISIKIDRGRHCDCEWFYMLPRDRDKLPSRSVSSDWLPTSRPWKKISDKKKKKKWAWWPVRNSIYPQVHVTFHLLGAACNLSHSGAVVAVHLQQLNYMIILILHDVLKWKHPSWYFLTHSPLLLRRMFFFFFLTWCHLKTHSWCFFSVVSKVMLSDP